MIVVNGKTGKTPPAIAECLKYLEVNSVNKMPIGKYLVDENGTYVMIQEYSTKSAEDCDWEAHKKYVDFQYIVSGKENVLVSELNNMQQGEYYADIDFNICFGEADEKILLEKGEGIVLFPEDVHMPCLHCEDMPTSVRKAVFKIPVTCFK